MSRQNAGTAPGKTYGSTDVERWLEAYAKSLSVKLEFVSRGEVRKGRVYVNIASSHELLGLAEIARKSYYAALCHFAKAADAWADLLASTLAGLEIDPALVGRSAGGFILGAASGDERVISRLAELHAKLVPNPEAGAHASYDVTIRSLAVGDIEAANRSWKDVTTSSDEWGWPEAVNAILKRDEAAFREAMGAMEDWWKSRVRDEHLQKYPDAVCDHYGFGWIRLAERAWGKRPDFVTGNIPLELFDAKASSEYR